MALTQNGEIIFEYYAECQDICEFANDWCEFSIYYGTNVCYDWWKYTDEFAEWVLTWLPFGNENIFGLNTELESVE
jgi:hypothetical protein